MNRRFLLAIGALVVGASGAAGLAGCRPDAAPPVATSDLAAALALVPADASFVEFTDRAAMAARLGLGDLRTGAPAGDVLAYQRAVSDQPASGTAMFLPAIAQMQTAPFSELDVRWSVVGRVGTASFQAFELDPDVDLGALADLLAAAGFTRDDVDGRPHLTATARAVTDPATGLVAGSFPASFLNVTVDPARHLLVVGPAAAAVLDAVDGRHPSLAATGTFASVLPDPGSGPAVEVALLDPSPTCGSAIGHLSRAQQLQVARSSAPLGTPRLRSYVVTDGGAGGVGGAGASAPTATASLVFVDDAAATADAVARDRYLRSGRLTTSGQLLSTLGTASVSATGPVVTVGLAYPALGRATEIAERGDGFLLCRTAAP